MANKETRVINIKIEVEDDTSFDKIEEIVGNALSEEGVNCTYSVEPLLPQYRAYITGDRNEPIISVLQDIQITKPELWEQLSKVIDYNLWDGYPLNIQVTNV